MTERHQPMHVPRALLCSALLLLLAACTDFTPSEKKAVVDSQTGELTLPHPCPDWSHDSAYNTDNSAHSNYGCATQTNMAIQLEDPRDWVRGHGDAGPDTDTTRAVIERYRAGEIPEPLVPQQATGSE